MTTTQATFDTPRILPEHLQAFYAAQAGPNTPGYTVRLLGTCTSLNGSAGTLNCGGFGEVSVILKTDARLQVGRLFEVVGKVIQLDNGQVCFALFLERLEALFELFANFFPNRDLDSGYWAPRIGVTRMIAVYVISSLSYDFWY
jgi:hypothetical protein